MFDRYFILYNFGCIPLVVAFLYFFRPRNAHVDREIGTGVKANFITDSMGMDSAESILFSSSLSAPPIRPSVPQLPQFPSFPNGARKWTNKSAGLC